MKKTLTALVTLILTAAPATAEALTVIGHRGQASTVAATENSRASIKAAMQAGAHGVEVDVRMTRDKKLVVMHDRTLDRTTGCVGEVTAMTYDEVRACTLNSGEKVPNVFDVAWEFSKHDVKSDKFWVHVKFKPSTSARADLFKAIDKYGLRSQTVIMADEGEMLDDFSKWSKIQHALIFNYDDVAQGPRESWAAGFDYAVPYDVPVTASLVATARKAGSKVYGIEGYPLSATRAEELGLDGMIFNEIPAK